MRRLKRSWVNDLWVASSCSLLHSPIDLSVETRLDAEVKSWFAFALQKCEELALLRDALNSGDTAAISEWSAPIQARRHSTRVHNAAVEKRLAAITAQDSQRQSAYEVRAEAQRARFNLPAWPTTTIGSFPQTTEIRGLRLDFKRAIWMRTTIAPASPSTSSRRLWSRNV
jgi:5-methyltetrahydropteroyltriglutamate--homocysteine methyltransferase